VAAERDERTAVVEDGRVVGGPPCASTTAATAAARRARRPTRSLPRDLGRGEVTRIGSPSARARPRRADSCRARRQPGARRRDSRLRVAERVPDEAGGRDRLDVFAEPADVPAAVDDTRRRHGRQRVAARSRAASCARADPSPAPSMRATARARIRARVRRRLHVAALDEFDVLASGAAPVRSCPRGGPRRANCATTSARSARCPSRPGSPWRGRRVRRGKQEILGHKYREKNKLTVSVKRFRR